TPLLAWLRALGVLAVYVLLRATLGLRRGPALLGAALTSAGALLLWIGYFNFEKQMAAWPLIPLGLLIGVAAVEELAGLTGEGSGVRAFLPRMRAIPTISRLLLATVALAILTAIVSAPAILDYWHGFAYRYNEQLTTLGVFFYIPATDILGLTPYLHGQAEPS